MPNLGFGIPVIGCGSTVCGIAASAAWADTFYASRRLTVQLLALGVSPFPLELDNYFLERDKTPLDEDGKPDFEAIEALDLALLADHLSHLLNGEEVLLPRYNFKTGLREDGELIRLKNGQPIILEGIHGLDPRLIPANLTEEAFRIY